jgi:hypothetical protein
MKPKQKYRLLVLAILSPYLLLLVFGLTTGTRSGKWVVPVCLCYGIAALAFMFHYLVMHPELRPTQEERAKRLAAINPRKAKLATFGFSLATLLSCSLYLFFAQEPPATLIRVHGVDAAHRYWALTRGAAWTGIAVTLVVLFRLWQVSHRNRASQARS